MTKNKVLVTTIVAAGMLLNAANVSAEVTGTLTLKTDNRFRGISQTAESMYVGAGIDYFNESGVYTGIWAQNVDFFETGGFFDDGAHIEADYYLGYSGALSDDVFYDVTLWYFTYPGDVVDQDYTEIGLGLDYGPVRVTFAYAGDYLNVDEDYQYIDVSYAMALPEEYGLRFQAGYSSGGIFDDTFNLSLEEYTDYSINLTKTFGNVDFVLSYVGTDISGEFEVEDDHLATDETITLSVSMTIY